MRIKGVRELKDFIQVITTAEKKEDCELLAKSVLEQRLAGCVQIVGPLKSTYWWKGRIETAEEWMCMIKTTRGLYGELEQVINRVHPYETPEVIALSIVKGSKAYLNWLNSELKAH